MRVSNPLEALAIGPLALLDLTLGAVIDTQAVLLTVLPQTVVLPAIGPCEHAATFFFVFVVLALILAAIRPGEDTMPVHLVVAPGAVVLPAVRPGVDTRSMDVILEELTRVG